MSRVAVLVALLAISPMDACRKVLERREASPPPAAPEPPPPVPITSATTPPIWTPPDPGGPLPAPAASAAAMGPDLAKARALASAGEHKKVRSLLEKKVKSGKASQEEAAVLFESCTALKDKTCLELVRKQHPELDE